MIFHDTTTLIRLLSCAKTDRDGIPILIGPRGQKIVNLVRKEDIYLITGFFERFTTPEVVAVLPRGTQEVYPGDRKLTKSEIAANPYLSVWQDKRPELPLREPRKLYAVSDEVFQSTLVWNSCCQPGEEIYMGNLLSLGHIYRRPCRNDSWESAGEVLTASLAEVCMLDVKRPAPSRKF